MKINIIWAPFLSFLASFCYVPTFLVFLCEKIKDQCYWKSNVWEKIWTWEELRKHCSKRALIYDYIFWTHYMVRAIKWSEQEGVHKILWRNVMHLTTSETCTMQCSLKNQLWISELALSALAWPLLHLARYYGVFSRCLIIESFPSVD